MLACPSERWQLDLGQEGLGLADVRDRLADAYEVRVPRFDLI